MKMQLMNETLRYDVLKQWIDIKKKLINKIIYFI